MASGRSVQTLYYKTHPIRFECTGCGACCHGGRNAYVLVGAAQAEKIRNYLGLSLSWFRRRYLYRLGAGQQGIRLEASGRCPFLLDEGKCRVYPVRPVQCSTYPFWSEVVSTRTAWQVEARRCEGIGRGAVIGKTRIAQAIEHSDEEEI